MDATYSDVDTSLAEAVGVYGPVMVHPDHEPPRIADRTPAGRDVAAPFEGLAWAEPEMEAGR